jgi:uncharacterized membrane protein YeaQ/YmgE (transglycosylase-associated protein family)
MTFVMWVLVAVLVGLVAEYAMKGGATGWGGILRSDSPGALS